MSEPGWQRTAKEAAVMASQLGMIKSIIPEDMVINDPLSADGKIVASVHMLLYGRSSLDLKKKAINGD